MAKRQPVKPRFLAKVEKTETCWLWTAWIERNGYGRFWLDGNQHGAHRVAYELFVGPIPKGLQIDHLCRIRHCVNPDHLEPVTAAENFRRSTGPDKRREWGRQNTHCAEGHPYTEENTYRDGRGRSCLTCKKAAARSWYERNREITIQRARQWHESNPDRAREVARESTRRYRAKKKEQAA